jgi:FkbM family methyltransferase
MENTKRSSAMNFSRKQWYRLRFLFLHPFNAIRFLVSTRNDYSRIEISEIQTYLPNPQMVIEAGAADGVDTEIFLSSFPETLIIALEPVREQYEYLKAKFKSMENLTIMNLALSNQNGLCSINLGSSDGNLGGLGSSSLLKPKMHTDFFPEIAFNKVQEVMAITLQELLRNIETVDLLWLDIQGMEHDVLSSSLEAFTTKIKFLHIEISKVPLYSGMPTERDIRKFLKKQGFDCVIDRVGAISGNALYLNKRFI